MPVPRSSLWRRSQRILVYSERKASGKAVVCADVGQNLMWVAQSFGLSGGNIAEFLRACAMGYSLPAGIGAYYASPNRQIICVMGDGGIQMNLQELQTVFRERIPLKIFIMIINLWG